MAFILILLSALFASFQNFFMRRSVDDTRGSHLYVPIQLFISFLIVTVIHPIYHHHFDISFSLATIATCMGIFLALMMWFLQSALQYGPAGMTFAVLNASSVMPSMGMTLLFGAALGHPYYWWNAVGSCLVVIGIFGVSGQGSKPIQKHFQWISLTLLSSVAYIIFSGMMQWKVLLETKPYTSFLLPFAINPLQAEWFLPIIFLVSSLFMLLRSVRVKKLIITKHTLYSACGGGIANGLSLYFMASSTQIASAWQNAMIFPIFSITVITLCNLWSRLLYHEKVRWMANLFCVSGLVVGTVNWPILFTRI